MELPHQFNFMAVGLPVIVVALAVALIVRQDKVVKADRLAVKKLNTLKAQ